AEAETAFVDAATTLPFQERGARRWRDKALHRLRQIGIGLAVSAYQRADPRYDVMEIGTKEGSPAGQVGLGDLERHHAAARPRDAAHLAQPLSQIGEIAQEKSRGDEGKRPSLEREGEGVGLDEPDADDP